MEPQLAAIAGAGSLLMGLSLGLFGAGGSILTVPLLAFLFAYPPVMATHYSLLIVGLVSAAGLALHGRAGKLPWRTGVEFALPAMAGMYAARKILLPSLPSFFSLWGERTISLNQLILASFAVLMILAAGSMLFVRIKDHPASRRTGHRRTLLLALTGFLTGAVSGFVGAGGGFLIVPSLVFLAGAPIKEASRASLLVIALNSLWGFMVATSDWRSLPLAQLLGVVALALVGMVAGTMILEKTKAERLKPAFGVFVLVMGIYVLVRASQPTP